MVISNRTYGESVLSYYYDASFLPSRLSLITYLDSKSSGFIESFGEMTKRLNQGDVRKELQKLARIRGATYPSRAELNSIAIDIATRSGNPSLASVVKSVSIETAQSISDYSVGILKYGIPIAIAVVSIYAAYRAGVFKK